MHTICIITYIISVKIEPRIFASVVSYDRSVELWKFNMADSRLGQPQIFMLQLYVDSVDQIHDFLLFAGFVSCWFCFCWFRFHIILNPN